MIAINLKYKDERDVTNAIVKLQDWLDENGKWVFGWSQETKYMVVDTRNRMKVNIAKAIRHYEQYIRGSGHSFFDFMNWAKTQGKGFRQLRVRWQLYFRVYVASGVRPIVAVLDRD